MPDIELRFNRDMLVLSAPPDVLLAEQGFALDQGLAPLVFWEADSVGAALRLEVAAGAPCLVAPTRDLARARLAQVRLERDAQAVAREALELCAELKPQHLLAELGPCGLPLDAASKASLNENRGEFAQAVRTLDACKTAGGARFEALLLNGFTRVAGLKCALMGAAQASGLPVLASVDVSAEGLLPSGEPLEEALAAMEDLGAAVAGFCTAAPAQTAAELARRAAAATSRPLLVQLAVRQRDKRQLGPTEQNPYYCPDAMEAAATRLYAEGVQFLRAAGNARPSYTGALVACVGGLDVRVGQRGRRRAGGED